MTYEMPDFEITVFRVEDIITTSNIDTYSENDTPMN